MFEHEPLFVAVCRLTGGRITAVISIKHKFRIKLGSLQGEWMMGWLQFQTPECAIACFSDGSLTAGHENIYKYMYVITNTC